MNSTAAPSSFAPNGYLPALTLDGDELFECTGEHDPLSCWQLPPAPWEAPRRPLAACSDVVVEGREVEAA